MQAPTNDQLKLLAIMPENGPFTVDLVGTVRDRDGTFPFAHLNKVEVIDGRKQLVGVEEKTVEDCVKDAVRFAGKRPYRYMCSDKVGSSVLNGQISSAGVTAALDEVHQFPPFWTKDNIAEYIDRAIRAHPNLSQP